VGNPVRARVAPDSEAYEKYLQGRFLYERRAPGDVAKSIQYFEEAVALDPDFARAWAALSGAYGLIITLGELPADPWRTKQRETALRATALDPASAEAESRLARYYFDVHDSAQGRVHSRRAFELNPNHPLVLGSLAGAATWNDDPATALEYYRKAAALDPLSATQRNNLAAGLGHAGLFDEAIGEYRVAQELGPGKSAEYELVIGQLHAASGRLDAAYASAMVLPEGLLRDQALALLHRAAGRENQAQAALARLVARSEHEHDTALAEVHAFRGDSDAAMAALEAAWNGLRSTPGVLEDRLWDFQVRLRISPLLRSMHGSPRFQALLIQRGSTGELARAARRDASD
jgi:serine/threonine-protein kinase